MFKNLEMSECSFDFFRDELFILSPFGNIFEFSDIDIDVSSSITAQ